MTKPKEETKERNLGGRPTGSKGIKKSKLRKVETKLLLLKDKALENIENSVNGNTVDKETLSNSRWVVNTLVTVSRAAIAEEKDFVDLKSGLNDGIEEPGFEEEQEKRPTFSQKMIIPFPSLKDLE